MTTTATKLGGMFTFPGTGMTVNRMGYGAMQLAGPHVFGPPKDRAAAVAVLQEAIESGVNHIDTSDFYGPHVTNQIIKEALHPYREGLVIVTKLGAKRDDVGNWIMARSREDLIEQAQGNLKNLGVETLDVVNLRVGALQTAEAGSIAEPMKTMIELKEQGIIQHIGLSTVNLEQVREAQTMTEIVCVQNFYNVANRADDAMIEELEKEGIAYVPYFPLGGFSPLQSSELNDVATELGATPMQVAQAWLLQRAKNVLLIPGTSSVGHLRENLAAAEVVLPEEMVVRLDGIGKA